MIILHYHPLYQSRQRLSIGSRQRLDTLTTSPTIRMNSTQVSNVRATKSFGVMIDDKLDWHNHIEKLTKKNRLWYRGPEAN